MDDHDRDSVSMDEIEAEGAVSLPNKEVLSLLDKARAEGLEVTHDRYAYTASSTGLVQLIPDKALDGGHDAFLARLADPSQKAAILEDMDVELAALEAKVMKVRHLKQGMMQQLLTGRIRLA